MNLDGWASFWAGLGLLILSITLMVGYLETWKKAAIWLRDSIFLVAVVTGVIYALILIFRAAA